jgi:hypothetical protein
MVYLDMISKFDSTYADFQVEIGQTYYYKLTAVDSFGNESDPSNEVMAVVNNMIMGNQDDMKTIGEFELQQNYPNPFNPSTTIGYYLPEKIQVKLIIFDVLGKKVCTLVDARQAAGHYKVGWDGRNELGQPVSAGVYFYQMTATRFQEVKKLFLQK